MAKAIFSFPHSLKPYHSAWVTVLLKQTDKRFTELAQFKCNISKNGDWQAKGVKEEPRCKLSTKGSKDHLVRNPESCETYSLRVEPFIPPQEGISTVSETPMMTSRTFRLWTHEALKHEVGPGTGLFILDSNSTRIESLVI